MIEAMAELEKRASRSELVDAIRGIRAKALAERRTLSDRELSQIESAVEQANAISAALGDYSSFALKPDTSNIDEVYARLRQPQPRATMQHTVTIGKDMSTETTSKSFEGIETYKRFAANGEELAPVTVFSRGAAMAPHTPTLSGVDPAELSIGRLIRARILGDWRGAEREREELRAMSTDVNTAGGVMVPDAIMARVIDYARNKSVLFKAGARAFDMPGQHVLMARGTSDPTMSLKSENAEWTATNVAFDSIGFTAHTIGAVIEVSRELVQDAPNVTEVITQQLAGAFATSLDASCLTGDGSNDLLGVMNLPSTQAEALSANISYDALIDAICDVETYNGTPNAFMLTPASAAYLRKLKSGDGANSAALYMAPPPSVAALQMLVSKQVASQECYLGDFTTVLVGFRLRPEIQISDVAGSAFEKNQIKVRLVARVDCNAEQPTWLKKYTALTT